MQIKKKEPSRIIRKGIGKVKGLFFFIIIIIIVLFLYAASCSCSKLALFHFSWDVCFSATLWLLSLLTPTCAQALVGRSYALCNFVCCHEISKKKKKILFLLRIRCAFYENSTV